MVDLNDLRQLASLLEKLKELEKYEKMEKDYEILKKEREELLDYKQRYLAIVGIVNWDKVTPLNQQEEKVEKEVVEIKPSSNVKVIETNGRTYGQCIRAERKSRRLSLKEVAEQCDLATCTVWEIENDIRKNNENSKLKLESGLGITIVYKNDQKDNDIKIIKKGNRTYGEIYREERLSQKLSLRQVGEKVNISASTVWDVETNRCKNNQRSREKVETALNIKVVE